MTPLKPLPSRDALRPRTVAWKTLGLGVLFGAALHLTLDTVTRKPPVTAVTAIGPAQPREELLHDQVVIVDQSGKTVLSPVMSRSDAIIEVDRWNHGYYHPNKELLPVGWIAVEVTRKGAK